MYWIKKGEFIMIPVQKLRVGLFAFLFLCSAGTQTAWADSERPWKTLTLKGGYFFSNSDTTFRFDPTGIPGGGTTIDLEDVLNLDANVSTFKVGAEWRFFDRHRFNVSYFDLSRDASSVLSATLNFGDFTFPISANINSVFDWKVLVASYTWSFLQTNTYELGFTIGANITKVRLGIALAAFPGVFAEEENAVLPLPVLGLSGAYAFTPKLLLKADGGWFGLKVGDVDGSQWNFNLDLEYNMWKYVGFGVGYSFYRLDVGVTDPDFSGEAKYDFHGVQAFLKFYL
jgi:hypothetical protein